MKTERKKELFKQLTTSVRELRHMSGVMSVDKGPYKKFQAWYESYENNDPALKVSGWESRVHTHVLKCAMGSAMLRRQEVHMRMSDLEEAFERTMEVENLLWAVHQNIQMNGELKEVKIVETAVKSGGEPGIRLTALRNKIGRRIGGRQFDDTIEHLRKSKVIHFQEQKTKGRPVKMYRHADYGPFPKEEPA